MAPRRSAGFVFVIGLLVLTGLGGLLTVSMLRSSTDLTAAHQAITLSQAFYVSEALTDCSANMFRYTDVEADVAIYCAATQNLWAELGIIIIPGTE